MKPPAWRLALGRHVIASLLACSPLTAQTKLFEHHGSAQNAALGWSIDGVGDLDHDGYDDFIVAAVGYTGSAPVTPYVDVVCGRTGKLMKHMLGPPGIAWGAAASGVGDIDGDGTPDFAIGAYGSYVPFSNAGAVYVYSGANWQVLLMPTGDSANDWFGVDVDGAGDVNIDGVLDIVVGSGLEGVVFGMEGSAKVMSGADGSLIHAAYGSAYFDILGHSVAGVGDITGDGVADFAAGAKYNGFARTYSGADGSIVYELNESATESLFGHQIGTCPDIDGDGAGELIVGAPIDATVATSAGAVHVFSGASGSPLFTIYGASERSYFGYSVDAAGDIDADGVPDVLASSVWCPFGFGSCHPGQIRALSGAAGGATIVTIDAPVDDPYSWAHRIANAGDVNGDGTSDVIAGSRTDSSDAISAGAAFVYSGKALSLSSDKHLVDLSPGANKTQTLRLTAGSSHGGELYFLLGTTSGTKPGVDLGGLVLPLNVDSYTLFTLGNPSKPPLTASLGFLSPSGTAISTFTIPAGAPGSLAGITAFHAYLLIGPSAITFASNAVPVSIVP